MGFLSAGLSSSVKVLYFCKLSPKYFIYLLVVEIQLLIGVSMALPVTLLNSCINIFFVCGFLRICSVSLSFLIWRHLSNCPGQSLRTVHSSSGRGGPAGRLLTLQGSSQAFLTDEVSCEFL